MKHSILLLSFFLIFSLSFSQQNDKKSALLIGISEYPNKFKLPDCDKYLDSLEILLKKKGYEVIKRKNLNQTDFKLTIQDFGDILKDADVSLFYYYGHAIQIEGNNYFIPKDADIKSEADVKNECVTFIRLLGEIKYANNKTNILIFDASRENMINSQYASYNVRGLAKEECPKGFFIAYASEPNTVAKINDKELLIFTSEIINNLRNPNIKIDALFRNVRKSVYLKTNKEQIPWTISAILDFEFNDVNTKK